MPTPALQAADELLSELNRLRADVARVPLLERRVNEPERALLVTTEARVQRWVDLITEKGPGR